MIEQLIAEATECDFKVALETKKPKSWLKSVSAFSNVIGETLFFGISDDRKTIGLSDIQKDAEAISRFIKERITPLPQFILKPLQEDGKNLLALEISPGRSTPYYYKADGVMEAYIRVGNESVIAPDYIVNELILKGTNQSFDTITTDAVKKNYSFTLLEATYLERTGLRFEPSDYISFGLTDKNGFLTNAGRLMTDQHTVYNSRIFCTRWNGLEKGSIFDDALDDKEYEGNLIYLLKSGSEFIRNNSKVRFVKEAQYRVDKPDYAKRAVTEALVNALIHHDYIVLHLIIYCCNIKAMQCHYNFNRFITSFTITSFSSDFDSAIINVIATNVPSLSLFSPSKNNALFLSKNSRNSDAAILLQPSAYG